jgi:hypothetical protein
MPAVNVRLKNFGKGPRGLYNSNGRAVVVDPGQEALTTLTETMVKFMRSHDGDLVVEVLDPVPEPAQEDTPKAASPNGQGPHGVSIPADWQSLPWPKLRGLASRVSPEKIKTMEDAKKAITAALAKE